MATRGGTVAAELLEVWVDPVNVAAWKRGVVCSRAFLVERPDGTFELGVDSRQAHFRFAGFATMATGAERRKEAVHAAAEV